MKSKTNEEPMGRMSLLLLALKLDVSNAHSRRAMTACRVPYIKRQVCSPAKNKPELQSEIHSRNSAQIREQLGHWN